jgi:hypothetical protein
MSSYYSLSGSIRIRDCHEVDDLLERLSQDWGGNFEIDIDHPRPGEFRVELDGGTLCGDEVPEIEDLVRALGPHALEPAVFRGRFGDQPRDVVVAATEEAGRVALSRFRLGQIAPLVGELTEADRARLVAMLPGSGRKVLSRKQGAEAGPDYRGENSLAGADRRQDRLEDRGDPRPRCRLPGSRASRGQGRCHRVAGAGDAPGPAGGDRGGEADAGSAGAPGAAGDGAQVRGVPVEDVDESRPLISLEREVEAAIARSQAMHEERILAVDSLGRRILRLRAEREGLADVVWLADASTPIRRLWSRVNTILGHEPTELEREALAIPPADAESGA